jgi:hypothetical protein
MAEPANLVAKKSNQPAPPAIISNTSRWQSPGEAGIASHGRGNDSSRSPRAVGETPSATAPAERDSRVLTAFADIMDRSLHPAAARFTVGLSPAALAHAHLDWATHLAFSPGKRLQLIDKAVQRPSQRRRKVYGTHRYSRPDLRGHHRARPCRAMAIDLQDRLSLVGMDPWTSSSLDV